MACFCKPGAVDDAGDSMFALASAQQVTPGSLAPLDLGQRHGWTARTDGHSWNQAVQRMEYILTGWKAAAGVTGRSAGGWANAGAQGRPRGCAEPASSRAGPVARASRPPPRRQAAARRRGGLRAARGAARAVLALHLRRGRRDFGQGIAPASRQGQRTAPVQRRVAVGEEKQRGCH